ncbi:MAG: CpaD family pilus assembly protein [Alphaproteobacteria bacterium]|nr:CpaD family pilus assembly protein [Alphaproteobacteria bacterium]
MKTILSAGMKVAAGAAVLLSSACMTKPAPADANLTSIADRHRIAVAEASERLEIPVAAEDTTLVGDGVTKVDTFARLYARQGHGVLVMSAPTGGANAAAATRVAQDVRLRLAGAGVPFAAMAATTYDGAAQGTAPIVLTFSRFDATAPDCEPLWSQDLAHSPDNQPWNSFGCSAQANLAAMISDPADLLGPRQEDPRDAARRARVLEAYRQGQQTHANRSSDERVQVSDAVR